MHVQYQSSRVGNGKGKARVICNRTARHEHFGYKSLSFTMAERARSVNGAPASTTDQHGAKSQRRSSSEPGTRAQAEHPRPRAILRPPPQEVGGREHLASTSTIVSTIATNLIGRYNTPSQGKHEFPK